MTEAHRSSEKRAEFKQARKMHYAQTDARVISADRTLIEIVDKIHESAVFLYVDEARALRDWLGEVLP